MSHVLLTGMKHFKTICWYEYIQHVWESSITQWTYTLNVHYSNYLLMIERGKLNLLCKYIQVLALETFVYYIIVEYVLSLAEHSSQPVSDNNILTMEFIRSIVQVDATYIQQQSLWSLNSFKTSLLSSSTLAKKVK